MTDDKEAPALEIHYDSIGGYCPVQAEGTINGKPFYFRARWDQWSIGIGGDDPVINPEWEWVERYGNNEFAAGWMEQDEAHAFIEAAAARYARGERQTIDSFTTPLAKR